MTPQYTATGRITINRENADVLGFKDSVSNSLEDYDYNVALDTQVQVLQSDTLATAVIKSLKLDSNPKFAGKLAVLKDSEVASNRTPPHGPA